MKKFVSLALIFVTVGIFIAAGTSAYADIFAQSPSLAKFAQPLRNLSVFDPNGIPVAASDGIRKWPGVTATHYTIDINQYTDTLLPAPYQSVRTTLWGYNPTKYLNTKGVPVNAPLQKHLGGIIVAERDTPVQITFRNNLIDGSPNNPLPNIIPVDPTILGANQAQNRTAVHLHGGFIPWISDGGPFDWWTPGDNDGKGITGASFLNNQVLRPGQKVPAREAEYYYPNQQSARLMWYHDHAYGITRINAYAGIASAYVITDWYEKLLTNFPVNLPGPVDPRTVYLIFQDKIFVDPSTIGTQDPSWNSVTPTVSQTFGSLWYAHVYDTNRWGSSTAGDPSVIPEFFGDTILVNGTVFPTVTLEQREYRFRMLNACNARFLNFRLVKTDQTKLEPDSYDFTFVDANNQTIVSPQPTSAPGFAQVQIGSEGGFLPYPAHLNTVGQDKLLLAPAERSDMIFDFRNVPEGYYILYNNASAPYPSGDDANDYFPGNPNNPTVSNPGAGPNTRTLLQIHVVKRTGAADRNINLPPFFTPTDPFLVFQKPTVPNPIPAPGADSMVVTVLPFFKVKAYVRHLTLNEDVDSYGRLIQKLGTNAPTGPGQFGIEYATNPTEVTTTGAYEVWEIANLTGDTHPIHFHLVNVQVLARAPFDANNYTGLAVPNGNIIPPDFNELGWKETVRMNPGQIIWVLIKFDLPKLPFKVPSSPRIDSYKMTPKGWIANEYVWHCHILEHEEHDMMRPLVVYSPEQKW